MVEKYRELSISREEVLAAKEKGEDGLSQLIQSVHNSGDLVFILENLGSLPTTFGSTCFIDLLKHENKDVRLWTVKNLGKLKSVELLSFFMDVIDSDPSTTVKREAVSSIGRMRTEAAIPTLVSILRNPDPKIVCQAIRGLLVFKGNDEVDVHLKNLSTTKTKWWYL